MQLFSEHSLHDKIKNQNKEVLQERWNNFQKFVSKIEQIKGWKEEKYQDGFLEDIFMNCLGYSLDTKSSDFNLEREKKNSNNSKKADGAITVDGNVVGVIELKGQDTKKFDSKGTNVIEQAFGYLTSHNRKYAHYVIMSNFDLIRFYIDDKLNYQEYSLFNLTYEQFEELHYLLCYENIKQNIPLKLKEQQSNHQDTISNEIYKKYSKLRVELFNNLIDNNEAIDKNILLIKTQKILDRMIFIFFAEDRDFIPADTIDKIIEQFKNDYRHEPLFEHFKIYFDAINKGNDRLDISAYNGGLFAEDDILDNLMISDNVLQEIPSQLTKYNFNTDIDVNILGHIFENSLNDIEELRASINDENFDKTKTKRKKDGVFYTPEYITKYIVDNTLGKLCEEKKDLLGLNSIDIVVPKNPSKLNKTELKTEQSLKDYREYLLSLKILDPACGSGAFLNQALNYLLQEHSYIDESEKTLLGGGGLFGEEKFAKTDVKKEVLEHNLYGVDINEEAVEIAKLSLWLRTIEDKRPLTRLADKLKVGNSLIDDKNVVPNAFEWEKEFPEVFENGGFDVVIGNPPYVSTKQIEKQHRDYFWDRYENLLISEMDLYEIFLYDNVYNKLSNNGLIGFITPNSYYTSKSFENLRKYIIEHTHILEIIDFPFRFFPFEDVNTETSIILLKKINLSTQLMTKFSTISKQELNNTLTIDDKVKNNIKTLFQNEIKVFFENKIIIKQSDVLIKLLKCKMKLGNYLELHKGWMSIPKQTIVNENIIEKGIFTKTEINTYQINNICHKYLEGRDTHRYYVDDVDKYVNIEKIDSKTKTWHFADKIILQRIVGQNKNKIFATYDNENHIIFPNANLVNSLIKEYDIRFFLSILNSTLISYFYNLYFGESNTNLTKLAFESIPIVDIENILKEPFIQKSELMITSNKKLQETKQNFIKELELDKVPKKLQNFETQEFEEFIKEYKKAKKLKLTKLEERKLKEEWEELFEHDKNKALELQSQINKTDKEIDSMVYELYGLTADEIEIVEGVQ